MNRLLLILIIIFSSSCVTLNSVSLTQIPKDREHPVSAHGFDWTFFGFATQNNFVDQAVKELKSKCDGGQITGILTKHQTTVYLWVYKREVLISGYCNQD